ncbi:MAG: sulfatase-like hydrolase/transferase [Acidobacteria bacterium]|nr:sulfatase-like hydrolase/transferase [Acidobacteriota bacterium]
MVNHKNKKKKVPIIQTNGKENVSSTQPSHEKKSLELSAIKKYLPFIGAILGILVVFYLVFGPGISASYKRKKLKDLNVILFTLDTLRADYVSAYVKGKADTPNIDKIASEGVLFETCIAQTPLTLPSHTSILSGSYPMYHQVRDNGGFLVPESLDFISEILQKNGFSTAAFIASYVLHSKWGVNQGFNTYSDDFDLTKYKKISLGNVQKRADEILGNAREWLTENKHKKFFTWIHLYDPHTPYDPPSPFKEKYAGRPYRGEVEYLDYELGLFFDWLKKEDIYDNTLIIMMADHGESLGEHDEDTHGFFIYEPTVRIPLIIRAPFSFPRHKIKAVTESIDVAPTILEALGIPIPAAYQGQSLLNLLFGNDDRKRNDAYTETYYPRFHYGWSELKAIYYNKNWKYILAPKQELYNLQQDAHEKENLALKESVEARRARDRLQEFSAEKSQNARKVGEMLKLDKDDLQKLAALGYFTNTVDTSNKTELADPKGKVVVFNNLASATKFMQEKKIGEAIKILETVIAENPQIVDGILQLGNAYTENKMHKEALACFYRVLDKKPDYQAAMINVINSLIRLGQLDKGIEEIQRFFKTFPRDHTLYNELGTIYFMKKEYEKALVALNKSLEIETINPNSLSKLGEIYVLKNDYQTAETYLNKAREINPTLPKLYFNLAQVEEARGNIDKAIEYYKIEVENSPDAFKSAYNAAEDLRKTGHFEEAVEYYKKAIEGNPQFNIPYFMIAKCYLDRRSNIDEAIRLCEQGIEIKPMNKYTAFGYYILSDIYSYKGNPARSGDYFAKGNEIKKILMQKNEWDREI